jgi:hypothetical protein
MLMPRQENNGELYSFKGKRALRTPFAKYIVSGFFLWCVLVVMKDVLHFFRCGNGAQFEKML